MKKVAISLAIAALMTGCASVPMESVEQMNQAKKFEAPAEGKSGLYIYRSGQFGGGLKKDLWLNGECIGETGPNVFFYVEVKGDEEYKLSTESEFTTNDLSFNAQSGKNYFVQQYITMGAFVWGAGLRYVDEDRGKAEVSKLKMAKPGRCSK